ncbi:MULTISPECIES: hypothetical protein [Calothrix]|uniref:Uncharacterized protein n=2 Tax=Calothrix TaxID=1186 RepID=A0ABR8A405_9CYAN|nr:MULTISPECIES: hypothetical protein [Calothrix]MBD2194626.1 hypothetical protein [Calothrix parietina FACHB-288]MBD2223268.1 hypothetical protein [Calothrix anomala FACHB-343]
MENQEIKQALEIEEESDFSPATDRGGEAKSDASNKQNSKLEKQQLKQAPTITPKSTLSPGTDREP